MTSPLQIETAAAEHGAEIDRVVATAFGGQDEVVLVRALRADRCETLELVALRGERVVGHIMFSQLRTQPAGRAGWSLAPMAVEPLAQRAGVGAALVRAGLEVVRDRGGEFVAVLGHADYYPKFGFDADLGRRVRSLYTSAGAAWMAMELVDGALERPVEVIYPRPFGGS